EDERGGLPGREGEFAERSRLRVVQRNRALERERQRRRFEDDAILVEDDIVRIAPVVEAGLHVDAEPDLAPYSDHASDEAMAVSGDAGHDRHEVLNLPDAARREEARDQDVRVWQ